MGRSVSVPSDAVLVVYIPHDCEDEYGWRDFQDDVRYIIQKRYPSFSHDRIQIDREEVAILSNDHAYIVLSEYCGLAAVSLVPRDDRDIRLGRPWCEQVAANLKALLDKHYNTVRKIGTASNGEAFYMRDGGTE